MMDHDVLDLIIQRLERIEKQNDDQLELLHGHLEKDAEYYKITDRHSTYFKGLGIVLTPLLGYIATKLGLK